MKLSWKGALGPLLQEVTMMEVAQHSSACCCAAGANPIRKSYSAYFWMKEEANGIQEVTWTTGASRLMTTDSPKDSDGAFLPSPMAFTSVSVQTGTTLPRQCLWCF